MIQSLENINAQRIKSLQEQKEKLPPANDLDKLFQEFFEELQEFLNSSQCILMDKLYRVIEHDYQNQGFIGKGYHCLEHNLEVAVLVLKACKKSNNLPGSMQQKLGIGLPVLDSKELLELGVAALLHDYDPHRTEGVPRVERTMHTLRTDQIIMDFLERLEVRFLNIVLFIERTDYPFSAEKETAWNAKLLLHFPNEWERKKFIKKAELLALLDKASTYFYLSVEKAHERVKALAEEMQVLEKHLLTQTFGFLVREKVVEAARWLPETYQKRWELVERHFRNIVELTSEKEPILTSKKIETGGFMESVAMKI